MTEVAAQRQVTAVNTLAKYKQENSQLRQEILTLRSAFPEGSNASLLPTRVVPGSPGSQPNLAEAITKIAELEKSSARFEEENVVLSGKANEAEAELKAAQEILEMVEKELENVRSEKERIEAASEAGKKTAVLEAEAAAKKANKDLLVEGRLHFSFRRISTDSIDACSDSTPYRTLSRSSPLEIAPTETQIVHPIDLVDVSITNRNERGEAQGGIGGD